MSISVTTCISIPIWNYFNFIDSILSIFSGILFQFLYGIILTRSLIHYCGNLGFISIPIWNYFNWYGLESSEFYNIISIPIWNYLNSVMSLLGLIHHSKISIPIWNYFNLIVVVVLFGALVAFQFLYGIEMS